MTIASQIRTAGPYTGNNAPAVYPFSFKVFAISDVLPVVIAADGTLTDLVHGVSCTVALNADQNNTPGGTVTATVASTSTLTITSVVALTQPASLTNAGGFYPRTIEDSLDRLTIVMQQMNDVASRAITLERGSTNLTLPPAAQTQDHLLMFGVNGTPEVTTFTATQLASAIAAAYAAGSSAAAVTFVGPDNNPNESRSIQDKARDVVSAKDFIRASDTTPDQWINRALSYASTQVKILIPTKVDLITSKVYLPSGLYRIAATIAVPEGVIFEGDSSASSVLWPTFTGIGVQVGAGSREISCAGLRRIGILGNYAGTLGTYGAWTTTTTVGVQLNKCTRACGLDEVLVAACQVGVQTVNSFQWHIRDSYFVYHLTNFIWADNGTASSVTGNRFDWCEGAIGIFIDGTDPSDETVGFHMQGGSVQLCWGSGVGLFDATSATFRDIHFEGNYRLATDAATHTYADIDIATGPNARGRAFAVEGCFFTPGTSPSVQAYTAIRCGKANVLTTGGNTVRDSRYYRAVDVLTGPAAVGRLVGIGNDFGGAAGKYAYDPTVTDVNIDEQDGVGVKTISKVRLGGVRLIASVGGSNQVTDGTKVDYYISTAAGTRGLKLRDTECVAGMHIELTKTSADTNALTVATIAADGVSASSKTISGQGALTASGPYASWTLGSDGLNWFVKAAVNPSAPIVVTTLPLQEVLAFNTSPATATAGIQFNTDGTISQQTNGGAYAVTGNYYLPTTAGIGSTLWVKVHQTSGNALTTGTVDTWLQLNAARAFTLATGGAPKDFVGTIAFSTDSGGATIVATGNLHLYAESS